MKKNGDEPPTRKQSVERYMEAKCRHIATYFCGECTSENVDIDGNEHVIFRLKMPGMDVLETPPIPIKKTLRPDPVEFFVKELYLKPSRPRKSMK